MKRKFTPIIGASRVGYSMAFYQVLDGFDYKEFTEDQNTYSPLRNPFNSNCQPYDFSIDKLYRHQSLDPMVLPGLGSMIGTELKRTEGMLHNNQLEVVIQEKIREDMQDLEPGVNKTAYREHKENELKVSVCGIMLTENAFIFDQQKGPLGNEYIDISLSITEPLGYYGSQPADKDDMKEFKDDKKDFFKQQMSGADDDKKDDDGFIPGFGMFLLILSVFISLIYLKRNQTYR